MWQQALQETQENSNEVEQKNSPVNSENEDDNKDDKKKLSKKQKKKAKKKQQQVEQNGQEVEKKVEQTVKKGEDKAEEAKQENKQQPQQQKGEDQGAGGKSKKDKKKEKGVKLSGAAKMALKKQEEQRARQEQQQRQRKEFEAEQQRVRLEEEEKRKKLQEQKQKKAQEQRIRVLDEKKKGLHMNKKQKQKMERIRAQLEGQKKTEQQLQKIEQKAEIDNAAEKTEEEVKQEKSKAQKIRKRQEAAGLLDQRQNFQAKEGQFRSPVCCILGHVDTGKTTLLDKIRNTNVQEGEAGGITQQIGATFFPDYKLIEEINKCAPFKKIDVSVPGLMIIDTPGHQSFSNLRSRGSSLCDIAILVIDLMHGLENQTLQSLQLLKKRKTPFVVALNKIDRCYGWQSDKNASSYLTLQNQKPETKQDFDSKLKKIITQLNEKGYNAELYWKNDEPEEFISLVPTSGVTGEGLPDLLMTLVEYSTTLPSITKKIRIKKDRFNCTVMEVKMIEGHGTTIDCILVDGTVKKEDQIVLLGFEGPIVTKVKALLTPHPMKQMRIKDEYLHHKAVHGANGVKISANNLDNAVAGTPLFVANTSEEVEEAMAMCENEYENVKKKIKLENMGVGVAASTLGSLEALLEYLNTEKIPVSHISVGPVSRDDVIRAMKATLSEVPEKRKKEYACLLVFDVKVLQDAQKYAEENEIKIFTANIIYHLTGFFNKYVAEVREERKIREGKEAIFPCLLKQVATFRKSDPIVLGVDVEFGVLKVGTPITIYKQKQKGEKPIRLGVVESIEHNHKKIKEARKVTGSVAISIVGDSSISSGRHFQQKDKLVSLISRRSIDCLKEHYKEEVTKEEWQLVIKLKECFNIV